MASSAPWTDEELAVLEDYAECRDWIDKALAELPFRTKAAARSMMQKVRARLEIDMSATDGPWMASAATASRRLLEALTATGLRPQ